MAALDRGVNNGGLRLRYLAQPKIEAQTLLQTILGSKVIASCDKVIVCLKLLGEYSRTVVIVPEMKKIFQDLREGVWIKS